MAAGATQAFRPHIVAVIARPAGDRTPEDHRTMYSEGSYRRSAALIAAVLVTGTLLGSRPAAAKRFPPPEQRTREGTPALWAGHFNNRAVTALPNFRISAGASNAIAAGDNYRQRLR